MTKVLGWFCTGIEAVLACCMGGMVLLVFGNVVLRYGFNSSILVSDELSRWLFVWMTFLGAALAFKEHAHLGVDAVVSRLSPAGQKACMVISYCVLIYIAVLLLQGSLEQTRINMQVSAPTSGLPLGLVHAAGLVFAVLTILFLGLDLLRMALRGGRPPASGEAVMVQEALAHAKEVGEAK